MSVAIATFLPVIERWSRDQVLALAPDAASRRAAQRVAGSAEWSGAGAGEGLVFGECAGGGARPYRACADLAEAAFRCDCPSRKIPCKHVLGLLLLWADGAVPEAASVPAWAGRRPARRRGPGAAGPAASGAAPGGLVGSGDPGRAGGRGPGGRPGDRPGDRPRSSGSAAAARREERVAAGLSELERWLDDQIRQGIAEARRTGPRAWDELHRRLVDAQAPGLAAVVARLPALLRADDWPGLLLGEYALMHLLAAGYRGETAEGALRDTIRSRIGFPVSREEVLAGERVRDHWDVIGCRDEERDRLVTRRVWLRGRATGRAAVVLSYAPAGQALDASLVPATTVDAELAFYPGATPLRALVAARHGVVDRGPPPGVTPAECLAEVARALAGDPWVDSWPVVLGRAVPGGDHTLLLARPEAGRDGEPAPGVPLHPDTGVPWRLIAVSGGHPVTVALEWTPRGFRPLTVWDPETGRGVIL